MLSRNDPFREMFALRRAMDRLLDNDTSWQPVPWDLALDVAETGDEFIVKASIPGINPDDLEITYTDNVLTIKGEMRQDQDVKEEQYRLRERRYGSFSRSISLPTQVNADGISASYDAGVLTLRLPKAEEVRPRKINISTRKTIEAHSKDGK